MEQTDDKSSKVPQLFMERRVDSWLDARRIIEEYSQHYIFRGQSNAEWLLRTSIERCSFFAKSYHVELDIVQEFQRASVSYPELTHPPAQDDYLSWLALMQHYGAPTRLLDFTHSPFVAAYFALESAAQDCAVWAIEKDQLKSDLHHKWRFEFHEDVFFDLKPNVFKEKKEKKGPEKREKRGQAQFLLSLWHASENAHPYRRHAAAHRPTRSQSLGVLL